LATVKQKINNLSFDFVKNPTLKVERPKVWIVDQVSQVLPIARAMTKHFATMPAIYLRKTQQKNSTKNTT